MSTSINWFRAGIGAVAAEVAQIAAAVGWVAFYSHVIAPGQSIEAYQAHAQASGPWVSIVAGAPIFYAASRWIARNKRTAMALFLLFLTLDVGLVLAMSAPGAALPFALFALSYGTKSIACYLGGARAEFVRMSEARASE
jgi:hypothetical protein